MVTIKVTIGGETRRLRVSDNITFKELQEKITLVFPELDQNVAPQLILTYKDQDGDIISLSSDEEVTLAINSLPSNGIWRVLARVRPSQSSKSTHRSLFGEPLFRLSPLLSFSSLLGGDLTTSLWGGLDSVVSEALKEREELIANLTKEAKKAQEKEDKPTEAEASDKPATADEAAKVSEDEPKKKPTCCGAAVEVTPGCCYHQTGSWEPVVFETPFSKTTIYGPVGYHFSWSSTGKKTEEEKPKEKTEETTEEKKEEETESVPTAPESTTKTLPEEVVVSDQ